MLTAVEHNFVNETPQQRFALSIRRGWILPDLREASGELDDLAMQDLAYPHLTDGLRRGLLNKRLLGCSDLAQGLLPASLKFRGNETIVGIDAVELAFGQCGGVALALKLPFRAGSQRRIDLLLSSARPRQRIKLGRRQGRQEASATTASTRAARMYWQAAKPSLERRWLHTYCPPPL